MAAGAAEVNLGYTPLIAAGNNAMSGRLAVTNGSASAPSIRGSDANTGIYFADNQVRFSVNGSDAMQIDSTGAVYFVLEDDSDATHSVKTGANPVNFNAWHRYKFYLDFTDLSNMDGWIDGDNTDFSTKVGNAGTATFDLRDTKIRLGQQYDQTVNHIGNIRNLRIYTE